VVAASGVGLKSHSDLSIMHLFKKLILGPTSLFSNGYLRLHRGIKQPRCEANHSFSSRAEVRNECTYTQ